jgi:hypothetical protein
MDIQRAFEILEIDLNQIKLTDVTHEYIKKKYHKLALINHPDKNCNNLEATVKFQQINEAYEYLLKELGEKENNLTDTFVSSSTNKDVNGRYIYFLSLFIESIIQGSYKELIKNVIKEIVTFPVGWRHNISFENIFEELDKDSALEVYRFICKYKHILYISNDTLDFVSLLIKKKYKNDRVFILNPSITDLLENNIFKLYVDDRLYLVPLWHNELYFETKLLDGLSSEIIVICNPELPEELEIDEDNNIHVSLDIEGIKLLEIIKNSGSYDFIIGSKSFSIPINHLYMKKEQICSVTGQGISRVLEDDMYGISCKADIIVKIRIV